MKRTIVFHPFLFAIYCVYGVYAQNVSQVPIDWTFRSLLILLLLTASLYLVLLWIYHDPERAGFVSLLFLVWLFIGHVYRLLLEWSPFWRTPSGGWIALLIISTPFVVLSSGGIWKKITSKRTITNFLNVVSAVLMVFPFLTIASILPQERSQIRLVQERQLLAEDPVASPA